MNVGRHTLQIPGPSPIPDRISRAISMPVIDHRGPAFARLGMEVLAGAKSVFQTSGPVVIYPSSGTGAWEAAIVNTLSSGDRVLMVETGHFALLWQAMAEKLGLAVDLIPGDWRHGVPPDAIEDRLRQDGSHSIKAVMIVHNETSTGVTSDVASVRRAIDSANHPALLLVDTISSLGSVEFRHDEWGIDVAVSCSQKGLMLPPGLGLVAISQKALNASANNDLRRSYWDWSEMLKPNSAGYFPYTPATNLLFGLREAIAMLHEEGMAQVFARHERLARATRAAVNAWGLEVLCVNPAEYSPVLTAVVVPSGYDADAFRKLALERFDISLGAGLSKYAGRLFRIGHLGECTDIALMGALSGVEMAMQLFGIPMTRCGTQAAMESLVEANQQMRKSRSEPYAPL